MLIFAFFFSHLIPHAKAALDFEAVFNEPGLHGAATTTIEDKFVELLNKAVPGSEVLMNIYGLRMRYIAKELIHAQARGVKVGVILRKFGDPASKESLSILKGLGQCEFGKCLKACGIACSAPAFNHNKFFLFSELNDGTKNIVIHTSNNFWPVERNNYNDFLIIRNNAELYRGLRHYWLTLYKGKQDPKLDEAIASGIKLHIFPKTLFRPENPVNDILKRVKCVSGSVIHIAHSRFTDPRSGIADTLASLKKNGCEVKLLIKNDVGLERVGPIQVTGDSPGPAVIRKLGDILYLFPYEEPVNGRPYQKTDPKRNALHSKIVLIHAPLGDDSKFQKLVLVGTHNFDVPSLKLNNEIMMEISDEKLFDAYEKSFQRLLGMFLELPANDRVACPRSGCISR